MQNLVALGFMAKYSEISKVFPLQIQVKLVTPGVGQIWPQGYNLGNLGRTPLDKATCKIWQAYALWLGTGRFLKFSLYNPI